MVGVTRMGFGEAGAQKIRTPIGVIHNGPEELTLEAPDGLEAEPTSPHSINLTWSAPPSHVNLDHYSVIIKVVHTDSVKTVLVNW